MPYEKNARPDNSTVYTPVEPAESQRWRKSVTIERPGDDPPIVHIQIDTSRPEAAKAFEVLVGAKMLAENLRILPPAAARQAGAVPFNASAKSQIGQVLATAQIPRDISEAVMAELQKTWTK